MAFSYRDLMYCRGCNRTFEVDHRLGDMLVEKTPRGIKYHPKADCDPRDREQILGDKASS